MREILFKAKVMDSKGKPMEENWVEGYYAKLGTGENIKHYIIQNGASPKLFEKEEDNMYFVDAEVYPETVCQYTRFNDKNRKKIFDGDIVKEKRKGIPETIYFVVWDLEEGSWMLESKSGARYGISSLNQSNLEVIGNIFDNPELIGKVMLEKTLFKCV